MKLQYASLALAFLLLSLAAGCKGVSPPKDWFKGASNNVVAPDYGELKAGAVAANPAASPAVPGGTSPALVNSNAVWGNTFASSGAGSANIGTSPNLTSSFGAGGGLNPPPTNYSPLAGGNPWTNPAGSNPQQPTDLLTGAKNWFGKAFGLNPTPNTGWPAPATNNTASNPYAVPATGGAAGGVASAWTPPINSAAANPSGNWNSATGVNNSVAFNTSSVKSGAVISRSGNWASNTSKSNVARESAPLIREPNIASGSLAPVVPLNGKPILDGTRTATPIIPAANSNSSWNASPGPRASVAAAQPANGGKSSIPELTQINAAAPANNTAKGVAPATVPR